MAMVMAMVMAAHREREREKEALLGPMVGWPDEAPQRQKSTLCFSKETSTLVHLATNRRPRNYAGVDFAAQLLIQFYAEVGLECGPPAPMVPARAVQSHAPALWRWGRERSWPDSGQARIAARGIKCCMVRIGLMLAPPPNSDYCASSPLCSSRATRATCVTYRSGQTQLWRRATSHRVPGQRKTDLI